MSMSAIPYFITYFIPLFIVLGAHMGGAFNFLGIAFVFGFIPLIDIIVGLDNYNPTPEEAKSLNNQMSFRFVTWLWVPAQLALIILGCWHAVTHQLTNVEYYGFVMSVGLATGGLGINISHELIHKSNFFEQLLGRILLVTTCYGHFYIEHIEGHHKRVATEEDPATSRLNESLYQFIPRSVVYSWVDAWKIEAKRLAKMGVSTWSVYNQMLHFLAASAACALGLHAAFGRGAVSYFLLQSLVAFVLLEVVNYIEHYGLIREKTASGAYSHVTPMHSWNAGHRITNYFLFKLQRHSDHHAYAQRRYQILRSFKASPQMPTGYAGMMLLSLCPPLWFRVMNPRVEALKARVKKYEELQVNPFADPNVDPLDSLVESSSSSSNSSKEQSRAA